MSAPLPDASLEIVPVLHPSQLGRFIRLPERLQKQDPFFVPPLRMERREALSRHRNPFFRHAVASFWLARRGRRVVGRISAQHDSLAPDARAGQFGMLLAENDPAVFDALMGTAERWAAARGLDRLQGPFSLSINEECGLLVEGFDAPPMMMMPHDPPYAAGHLERLGYTKAQDLLAFLCDMNATLPPAAAALVARGLPQGVVLRPLRRDRLHAEIAALADIFNDAWHDNWGFVPITPEEVAHMAEALKPLLHDRLVWFAEVDGEPAAFGLCLPNLNEAIRGLDGRLLPFGWAQLLWRLKVGGIRTGRVPLMGVRRRYANSVLGSLLPLHVVEALRREAVAIGIEHAEMSWVLESNQPMRRLAEAMGGRPYKRYRLFEKRLA
ncbi:GNAT family N-acetyltransferase [Rhizosaccharibacter radicis]|uniref:dATP pyrophosphohydrolase n=1 Tax=Rhizosaccharibacter radicis TaxID=2782605 RepID=A0ABT1VVH6_9PROT|nr:dATP pyrophosphohydrolase [Acetobacteraceae bacterium KSS12]